MACYRQRGHGQPARCRLCGRTPAVALLATWSVIVLLADARLFAQQTTPPAGPVPSRDAQRSAVYALGEQLQPSRTLVYKTVGNKPLALHLFHPDDYRPQDRRAALVVIHGGGWRGGSPRQFYAVARHAAERGMLGISLEYRVASTVPGTTPQDCVRDGRSAMRYLRRQAGELGIDPDRIVVCGASAGGHVAAGTALFDGLDEQGEDASVSCRPAALVLFYPVIDTSRDGYGHDRLGERWQEVSPLHQVRAGVPPTLLFHGTADRVTPFAGARAFEQRMRQAGNRCQLVVQPDGEHGHIVFHQELFTDALRRMDEFLAAEGVWPVPAAKKSPEAVPQPR